jgi:transglutaminase-like putative cysteine protease
MTKLKKRWWDTWAALLLLGVVITSANRLVITKWTAHLGLPAYIAFFGAVLGLALGASRFSGRLTAFLGFVYTLFVIPWVLGVNLTYGSVWSERMLGLAGRLMYAMTDFYSGIPVKDPILFLFIMSLLYWLLGITAGYFLARHASTWLAVLPNGLALLVVNHYDRLQRSAFYLVLLYLFLALLILARVTYLKYKEEWTRANVFESPEASFDLTRTALVTGAILVVLAWNIPGSAGESARLAQRWQELTRPWVGVREKLSNAVASLRTSVVEITDYYGDELSLGTGAALGDQVIFTAKAPLNIREGARIYWWARSYDSYQSGKWSSTQTKHQSFNAATFNFPYPEWSGRQEVTITIYPQLATQATFVTGSTPLSITRPGEAIVWFAPDGTADISTLIARPAIRIGESYQSKISISVPTILQLRESGSIYPEWVKNRYLQLPSNMPTSISRLAGQITAGLNNPYDQAQAITNYLRTNITYAEILPKPPADQDPIEWFLFDIRQGYCNYYATAEVLMLRSLGIPTRLSVGYAQGSYDDTVQRYMVIHKDSHAWPEVYFAGVGWVEFEPTVSQPARNLASGENNAVQTPTIAPGAGGVNPANPTATPYGYGNDLGTEIQAARVNLRNQILLWTGIILFAAGMGYLLWRYGQPRLGQLTRLPLPVLIETGLARRGRTVPAWLRSWSRRTQMTPFEKVYADLAKVIHLLGSKALPCETPSERVTGLIAVLPEATDAAHVLLSEFQHDLFSPIHGDLARAQNAGRQIRRMAQSAYLRRLLTTHQ